MVESTERPNVEEVYQTASNTSNLTVEADRKGAGDVLIAAGWSVSRVGMALLRLHSEYDSSEKPIQPTPDSIKALVGTFQRELPEDEKARETAKLPPPKSVPLTAGSAKHYASTWYSHEVGMLLGKMKALPTVREQVAYKAASWRMEDAHAKAAAVIRYWLDQTCSSCHGLKWQITPGSPALSNRMCKACQGSGIASIPHGQEGRRIANWMDMCVEDARGRVRRNLANMRKARNKVVDRFGGRVIIAPVDGTGC